MLGPWAIAHPARVVARAALEDSAWQAAERTRLLAASQRLGEMLAPLGTVRRTALFCTVGGGDTPLATEALAEHFARCGILVRRFDTHGLVRFGLPGNETEWHRLAAAVGEWSPS